jgi:hypothetical protein
MMLYYRATRMTIHLEYNFEDYEKDFINVSDSAFALMPSEESQKV